MVQKAGSKCRMVGFWGGPSSWISVRNLLAMVLQVKRTGAFSGVFSKMPVLWDSRPTPWPQVTSVTFHFRTQRLEQEVETTQTADQLCVDRVRG